MKYLNLNMWLNYLPDSLCGSFDSKAKLLVAEFLIAWNGLFLPLYRMIIITVMIIIITLTMIIMLETMIILKVMMIIMQVMMLLMMVMLEMMMVFPSSSKNIGSQCNWQIQ